MTSDKEVKAAQQEFIQTLLSFMTAKNQVMRKDATYGERFKREVFGDREHIPTTELSEEEAKTYTAKIKLLKDTFV